MLETQNLVKIYRPKKGVPVKALNGISLKFREKGMVFLLGKSGSGKSTLLNVLGGLDSYTDGDILIKGVSTKEFRQVHFDSYRNTYVGFIFQEYNVLDEFTVGANIALALELQGKKATDEEINAILHEVELDGYGTRHPGELSGGQKQRVAIARALVKNPDIIMADEPTGALDSHTGRQVLETLKKLSAEKLVIVVSHDREFAYTYGDRIIELADGVVISDLERTGESLPQSETGLHYEEGTISVPQGYQLTEEDRKQINEYLAALSGGVVLRMAEENAQSGFTKTKTDSIVTRVEEGFRLIKSKLPLRSAFKLGSGGLKHKKFRLVMTILLSCVAFTLFGLADCFASYQHVRACTRSLIDSDIDYLSVEKEYREKEDDAYWYFDKMKQEDLDRFTQETGIPLTGLYQPSRYGSFYFEDNLDAKKLSNAEDSALYWKLYSTGFNGIAEVTEPFLNEIGGTILAGRVPDGSKKEIAISAYVFESFRLGGYRENAEQEKYEEIKDYPDMLGKTLLLNSEPFTVTAVYDTHMDLERYRPLMEAKEISNADLIKFFILEQEFDSARDNSLANVMMVGEGYLDAMTKNRFVYDGSLGNWSLYADENAVVIEGIEGMEKYVFGGWYDTTQIARLSDIPKDAVIWAPGMENLTKLEKNQIIVSSKSLENNNSSLEAVKQAGSKFWNVKYSGGLYLYDYSGDGGDDYFTDVTIVGVVDAAKCPGIGYAMVTADEIFNLLVDTESGIYSGAVGRMPTNASGIEKVVKYCYPEKGLERFGMKNPVTFELDSFQEIIQELAKIFVYIGLGFAVFASLMLANFIGTSISYKKKEIGILRAIGSRANDVFRIFFSESFIIAMINFALSTAFVVVVVFYINHLLREEVGTLITVLTFGVRQVLLLLIVSVGVAWIASFLPVRRIAAKKPIDAIRDR